LFIIGLLATQSTLSRESAAGFFLVKDVQKCLELSFQNVKART
jgi:hypothetical protein